MPKYIDRDKLIDYFYCYGAWLVYGDNIPAIISRIKAAPVVDAVEVVRCENCKHRQIDCFGRTVCIRNGQMIEIKDNDYCSNGERKEE